MLISFDRAHSLYSVQLRLAPDGENYVFERHDIGNAELATLCAEGFDVRAVGDSPDLVDFFPPAVEFYHAGLDHYFIAIDPIEINDLDSGVHAGLARTAQSFRIYVTDSSIASGRMPLASVCRYAAHVPKARCPSIDSTTIASTSIIATRHRS